MHKRRVLQKKKKKMLLMIFNFPNDLHQCAVNYLTVLGNSRPFTALQQKEKDRIDY